MPRRIVLRRSLIAGDHTRAANIPPGSEALAMLDLFVIGRILLARRILIVAVTLAITMVAAVLAFLMPDRFTSRATILPSGNVDQMSELRSLAGLAGIAAADDNSSELFPTILRSRLVAAAVLSREYRDDTAASAAATSLTAYFDRENPDELVESLHEITAVSRDSKSGVITLEVETTMPQLSQEIAEQYLAALETFNLEQRKSAAKENAAYLERQTTTAAQELTAAEDSLEAFQRVNRGWTTSSHPGILKTVSRLRREIEVRSAAYVYLVREYEAAKLEAQKDIPIVRILDAPSLPTQPSGPKRLAMIVGVLMATFVLTSGAALILESRRVRMTDLQNGGEVMPEAESVAPSRAGSVRHRRSEPVVP